MMKNTYLKIACLFLWIVLSGCTSATEIIPAETPQLEGLEESTPSATTEATSSPTQEILFTPTLRYTPDAQMETILQDAGDLILTHGIIFQ
ncbi:MAG: hypothetical protein PVF49_13380, partial [Anaerolineales bacterium]